MGSPFRTGLFHRRDPLHPIIKLLTNIKAAGDCWEWQRSTSRGYGNIWVNGKALSTHRYTYELAHGQIPDGMFVLHSCDNKKCCNPGHLILGTHQDNMQHVRARGQCKGNHGHPSKSDTLYWI